MTTHTFDTLVLGAGASGLVAGAVAANLGSNVAIFDHASKAGRKILISGGGKCNLTNLHISHKDYLGENPEFVRSALTSFTPSMLLEKMNLAQIPLEERECGQIFCKRTSSDLLELLLQDCAKSGCTLVLGESIVSVNLERNNSYPFVVRCKQNIFLGKHLVVALGGCAYPQIGATHLGYHLAKNFGHEVITPYPALVGLVMPKNWPCATLAGIALPVSLYIESPSSELPQNIKLAQSPKALKDSKVSKSLLVAENLNLLFTHGGISGPAVLQASLYWRLHQVILCQFVVPEVFHNLMERKESGKVLLKNLCKQLLPYRLVESLLPAELADKKVAELSRAQRTHAQNLLCAYPLKPIGTEGFRKAEVTGGGVSTQHISSKTMESKLVPNLYFCGEVLDITGRLGGYNLHWAFASGTAAGKAIGEK